MHEHSKKDQLETEAEEEIPTDKSEASKVHVVNKKIKIYKV